MASTRKIQRYGWRPSIPDFRNLQFSARLETLQALPNSVDMTSQCPPVYDQGQLGSCTGNSIGAAVEFDQMKEGDTSWTPSRLFIYYNERVLEGSVNSDAGASNADGFKTVNQQGVPPETEWSYNINEFRTKPPIQAYTDALKTKSVTYMEVAQDLATIQACLADGYPVVVGFSVYSSFESNAATQTGDIPMPGPREQVLGGHSVLLVGYNNTTQRFLFRNSWGTSWGNKGYGTLPYAYILSSSISGDFWTMRSVTPVGPTPPPPPPPPTGNVVTASNLTATTQSGIPVTIVPKASCSNPNTTVALYQLPNWPTNGTLNVSVDGAFVYTSNAGFTGIDAFTYTATDNMIPPNTSNVATVTITVKANPPIPAARIQLRSSKDNTTWTTLYDSGVT